MTTSSEIKILDKLGKMSLMPTIRNNPRISHAYDHPSTMDIWEPFRDFSDSLNNMIGSTPLGGVARMEWEGTPEMYIMKVELPGFGKEEIEVRVEEGKVVKIKGNKEVEKEEKHENWHHFERSEGKFLKVFSLPENCRHDQVKSSWKNEVLTVTVPKRDVETSHVKNIEVKG